MSARIATQVEVEELSRAEGRAMLNQHTLDRLGIDVDEFLGKLDAGDYLDSTDEDVLRLVMLAPFAR